MSDYPLSRRYSVLCVCIVYFVDAFLVVFTIKEVKFKWFFSGSLYLIWSDHHAETFTTNIQPITKGAIWNGFIIAKPFLYCVDYFCWMASVCVITNFFFLKRKTHMDTRSPLTSHHCWTTTSTAGETLWTKCNICATFTCCQYFHTFSSLFCVLRISQGTTTTKLKIVLFQRNATQNYVAVVVVGMVYKILYICTSIQERKKHKNICLCSKAL